MLFKVKELLVIITRVGVVITLGCCYEIVLLFELIVFLLSDPVVDTRIIEGTAGVVSKEALPGKVSCL